MKKLVKILALSLVLVFTFALVACGSNSYSKIEKAFINEGYTVESKMDSLATAAKSELEKEGIAVEAHTLKIAEDNNGVVNYDYVVILELKKSDDVATACEKSATLKSIIKDATTYDALVEKGWANGNCIVFGVTATSRSAVKKIVKAA